MDRGTVESLFKEGWYRRFARLNLDIDWLRRRPGDQYTVIYWAPHEGINILLQRQRIWAYGFAALIGLDIGATPGPDNYHDEAEEFDDVEGPEATYPGDIGDRDEIFTSSSDDDSDGSDDTVDNAYEGDNDSNDIDDDANDEDKGDNDWGLEEDDADEEEGEDRAANGDPKD
ncbi:hypothetical protein FGLOB1_14055 [Fusarium globosum]|uniref:Uncharacterized protein n=1 Tax=Fusarium globosum TaxID=78864 RepID=A0A8H5XKB8_9HYPO|nr:hypothetical protein FGLOB1_14055 [Fusarium globosum]